MAWQEKIPSEENRLFTSSIGDWTGNIVWEPGPHDGYSGMAKLTRASASDPDSMTLSFPFISAFETLYSSLAIAVAQFPGGFGFYTKLILTDGINTLENEYPSVIGPWVLHYFNPPIPSGWISSATKLIAKIRPATIDWPIIAVYKFASLRLWTEKTQHLPIMGVG